LIRPEIGIRKLSERGRVDHKSYLVDFAGRRWQHKLTPQRIHAPLCSMFHTRWLYLQSYSEASDTGKNATRVGRRRKFGEVSCTEYTVQGNDFDLTPTVKRETRHLLEESFGSEFPAICNRCGVMAAGSLKTPSRAVK